MTRAPNSSGIFAPPKRTRRDKLQAAGAKLLTGETDSE